MTIVWTILGLAALVTASLWFKWREKNQAEAVKQYILETTELERQLALLNPRLARGERLEPDEQAWLEKMLFERRITSDSTKWAAPNLGYDALSGTMGEFFSTYIASGGSPELLEIKSKQVHAEKVQRMLADIGGCPDTKKEIEEWWVKPETQKQVNRWWAAHSMDEARTRCDDVVMPGQRIYHAAVVRKPTFTALYKAA